MIENNDIIDKLVFEWKAENPLLDANAMHIVGRIIKIGKLLEKKANIAIQGNGVHYTDLDVLATIRRSGAPYELTPKELMRSVLITSGAMTALLDRLTKLELIYRTPGKNDGRVKLVGLTNKGKKIVDKAIEIRFKEAKTNIKTLSETEFSDLSNLLRKLLLYLE